MLRSLALSVLLHTGLIALALLSIFASRKPLPQSDPAPLAEPFAEEPVPDHYPPLVLTRVPSRYPQSQPLQTASQQPSLHTSQQASLQLQPPPPEGRLGGTAW